LAAHPSLFAGGGWLGQQTCMLALPRGMADQRCVDRAFCVTRPRLVVADPDLPGFGGLVWNI